MTRSFLRTLLSGVLLALLPSLAPAQTPGIATGPAPSDAWRTPAHALAVLQEARGATDPGTWGALARAWAERGAHAEALAALQRVPGADPGLRTREIAELALTYARGGDCARAGELIPAALENARRILAPSGTELSPVVRALVRCGRETEATALVEAPPVPAAARPRVRPILMEGLALAFSSLGVAPAALRVIGGIAETVIASRARVSAADRLRNAGQAPAAAEVLREVIAAELDAEQGRLAVDVLLEAGAVEQALALVRRLPAGEREPAVLRLARRLARDGDDVRARALAALLPQPTAVTTRLEQAMISGHLAAGDVAPEEALRPLGPDAWRVALDGARSARVSRDGARAADLLRRSEALLEGEAPCGRCWSQVAGEWLRLRDEPRAAFALDRSVEGYDVEWREDPRSRVDRSELLALDAGYRAANREPGPGARAALERIVENGLLGGEGG